MRINKTVIRYLVLGLLLPFLGSACGSLGPKKITADRLDYSTVLAESWKKQMLLNILKVRYLDLPIFLDVGQLVTGYSMETSVNAGGSFAGGTGVGSLGASGKYTDRPTITYMPMTGDRFLESFLTPIQPLHVFSLVQSGYPADFILELCLDSFNGLQNRSSSIGVQNEHDPEFFRVLTLMREIQDESGFGLRTRETEDGPKYFIYFRNTRVSEVVKAKSEEIRNLLQIPMDIAEFELVYTPAQGGPGELGVATRSLWQILGAMSMGVVVPDSHDQRRLVPPLDEIGVKEDALLHVHSSTEKPKQSYVTVSYEGEWFWIAEDDWDSKRTFSSILFLFTLAGNYGSEGLPTITIPTF